MIKTLHKRKVRIAPSLLSADFARLADDVGAVEAAGCEVLHLDVMDGHFVPNISFGVPVIASLRKATKLVLDAHLMIAEPERYAEAFAQSGCDLLTFHIEVAEDPMAMVKHIRNLGVGVGVSLNPDTPASSIDSIIEEVDLVLVMSVWPGFGGQSFMPKVLPKTEELATRLRSDQRLEIDGGIDKQTIASAAAAGADLFVAGTAVFRQNDPPSAMSELKSRAERAWEDAGLA